MTTVIQTEQIKNRHLIFRITNDLYGLEVHYLKEVFQTRNILKLPRTSSVLEGIVNLRGYIVSIFNLSVILWGKDSRKEEEPSSKSGSSSKIILLVTIKDQDIGILVDQIHKLDTITDFETKNKSHFQGRELLNSSLISKIGFLNDKQTVFILNLEELLGDFITSKKSEKSRIATSDEDFDFDFDQYTLPDSEEPSEKSPPEVSANFDIDQLNLPENLQSDEFDQTILDKVEIKESKEKKKGKGAKGQSKTKKKSEKAQDTSETKNKVKTEKDFEETNNIEVKDEVKGDNNTKMSKGSKNAKENEKNQ